MTLDVRRRIYERLLEAAQTSQVDPTAEYHDVLEALSQYVEFNSKKSLTPQIVDQIKSLVSEGKYPFLPPATQKVYRGVRLNDQRMRKLLKLPDDRGPQILGNLEGTFIISPLPGASVTSWSTDPDAATRFKQTISQYSVMFELDVSQHAGRLLDMAAIYPLIDLDAVSREAEVLALGPVTANRVEWKKEDF